MVCSDPIWKDNIKYCFSNSAWFVGDNETEGLKFTAVKSNTDVSGTIIIPEFVDGHPITQIARCAFFQCYLITKIIVKAKITVINYRGFSQIYNLQSIQLPSTLEVIYQYGIDMYNWNTQNYNTGITNVIFEPNTHLKYLGEFAFAWRTYFILVISNDMNPDKHKNYIRDTALLIKSPDLNTFADIQSDFISKEIYNVLCNIRLETKSECINTIHSPFLYIILVKIT